MARCLMSDEDGREDRVLSFVDRLLLFVVGGGARVACEIGSCLYGGGRGD